MISKDPSQARQTYYEVLGVASSASAAAIEQACDSLYEKWHRLVTHHELADQATQALKTVEAIRATLLDTRVRAAYDAGIGIRGAHGLADPELVANPIGSLPLPPPPLGTAPSSPTTTPDERTDAWVCPQCARANALRTRFCETCGFALGRDCPACRSLVRASTRFCPDCGANIAEHDEAERRRTEVARLEEESAREEEERWRRGALEAERLWVQTTLGNLRAGPKVSTLVLVVEAPVEDLVNEVAGTLDTDGLDLGRRVRFWVSWRSATEGRLSASWGLVGVTNVTVLAYCGDLRRRAVIVRVWNQGPFPAASPDEVAVAIADEIEDAFPVEDYPLESSALRDW